jgi:hypothetical protein
MVRKTLFSLAFSLSCIGMLMVLVSGLCSLVVITIVFIRSESDSWMDETGKSLTAQQTLNLCTITEAKAQFSKSSVDRASLDTQVTSRHFTELLEDDQVANSFPAIMSSQALRMIPTTPPPHTVPLLVLLSRLLWILLPSCCHLRNTLSLNVPRQLLRVTGLCCLTTTRTRTHDAQGRVSRPYL